MPRPRKKPVDLGALADEVNDILHALVRAGYADEVARIRTFLEEQGKHFMTAQKTNRDINNAMSLRVRAAEQTLRKAGLEVPK